MTEILLGSILRIDVDSRESGKEYAVPTDNPLVGTDGLDEHYAWGFRNPWGMSFDGRDFFVADVGQDEYEEVNLVGKGGNYGWNVREGTRCYTADACPVETPETVRDGESLRSPVVEYSHDDELVSGNAVIGDDVYGGTSVVGGCVYRGTGVPALKGAYIFADVNTSGRLFVATRPGNRETWPIQAVAVTDADKLARSFAFGRDDDGEVYVLGGGTDSGGLYRIEAPE